MSISIKLSPSTAKAVINKAKAEGIASAIIYLSNIIVKSGVRPSTARTRATELVDQLVLGGLI